MLTVTGWMWYNIILFRQGSDEPDIGNKKFYICKGEKR